MLIVVGSVKGSPGVTSLAVAMAARWPAPAAALVVELDPAGGDLGSRWNLHDEPGLRNMVATVCYEPLTEAADWSQRLPIGVDVVIAPSGQNASYTVAAFAAAGPAALRDLAAARPVLVDAGRLDSGSPVLAFVDLADLLLMVTRPRLEDVRHLRAALPTLRRRCPAVGLVLAGSGPYPPGEIARYLQADIVATVRHDRLGADIVAGRRRTAWGWTRQQLFRTARTLTLNLTSATTGTGMAYRRPVEAEPQAVAEVNA